MKWAYGGLAKGIPRNLFVVPSRAPTKVPLSSVTEGTVVEKAAERAVCPARSAGMI